MHVNVTTNLQNILYLCILLSGCFKYNRNLPCENSLFLKKTLTCYLHCTISMWGQTEKSMAAWLHHIRNIQIRAPRRPPLLMLHHPPKFDASTLPTKNNVSYQIFTQLYSLPSELFNNIGMSRAGILHCNKLKPVLVRLT